MFGIIGLFLFHVSSGGVIRTLDACSMCGMEDNVLKCAGIEMTAVVSLEACPGSHLWTGRDLLVTELRGWATQVQLARTTLECNDIPDGTVAYLNGEKCVSKIFQYYKIPNIMSEHLATQKQRQSASATNF